MNKIKWTAVIISWLLVLLPFYLTRLNGTYSRDKNKVLKQPFNEHWESYYGDPLMVEPALCLIIYYLPPASLYNYAICFTAGLICSWIANQEWWKGESGHLMPDRKRSAGNQKKWFLDLSISGWLHFLFSAFSLALLIEYAINARPPWYAAVAIGYLFLAFNIIGILSYQYAIVRVGEIITYSKSQEMIVRFAAVIIITTLKLL